MCKAVCKFYSEFTNNNYNSTVLQETSGGQQLPLISSVQPDTAVKTNMDALNM